MAPARWAISATRPSMPQPQPQPPPLLPIFAVSSPGNRPGFYMIRARLQTLISIGKKVVPALLLFATLGHLSIMPVIRAYQAIRSDVSGLEVHHLALSIKAVEALLAALSIAIVMAVYTTLIRRSPLLSTTAIYPCSAIEKNIGSLLSEAWPDSSTDLIHHGPENRTHSERSTSPLPNRPRRIRLLYLGKLTEEQGILHAKGLHETTAKPDAAVTKSRIWLTSGSPLTKSIIQLLVWEWASLWLLVLMNLTTLMFNGFFTGDLSVDSYPRLTIVVLYSAGYIAHCCFVNGVVSAFFTNVGAGAAWSLLERANFAICHPARIGNHQPGQLFQFDSIDKASAEHVPTTYSARLYHERSIQSQGFADTSPRSLPKREIDPLTLDVRQLPHREDARDIKAALATLKAAQENERIAAREAAQTALERVITNAMILMGITLSSGFSSWTASQTTSDSPNNYNSSQIGSLALLASLSLGAAAMFTSAMHLTTMNASFRTILSLKETKINDQAVDHVKKRTSTKPTLSFSNHSLETQDRNTAPHSNQLKAATIGLMDVLATTKISHFFHTMLYGPAYVLLPSEHDHARTSTNLQYSLHTMVRGSTVILTTSGTDKHAKTADGTNVESINVCCIDLRGTEDSGSEKAGLSEQVLEKTIVGDVAV